MMIKVLVVDDEKSMRVTLCEFLKNEGFEAESASDAQIAWQMIQESEFDVVVTDIIMPKMSGIDLLSNIRKKSQTLQVIIMTGEPTVDTAITAVQSGANDYLIKPITRDALLKAVHHASQIKLLHDEKTILEKQNQLYQRDLEDIVEKRTIALQKAMQGIVFLLSSVVEVRDPYTAGHQVRVGNLAAAIAQKMKMDMATVKLIRIIGYIHDIGKIVIPSEILSKPGKLSFLEMEMIKLHPLRGYEMLARVELPDLIGETIYQHHERLDGSGYPKGLKQEAINQEAQIVMVADVVEAMVSHRPYRPGLGLEAALQEITQNSGTLYNPDVVSACLSLFNEDRYVITDFVHELCFQL